MEEKNNLAIRLLSGLLGAAIVIVPVLIAIAIIVWLVRIIALGIVG